MGDMADWAYDQEMDMRQEFEDEMTYLLNKNDDYLRKETALTRNKKLMSIRKWPHPLSDKQKWCLALWILQHDPD